MLTMKTDREKIQFFIDHIDPLGQGVSKKNDGTVSFIPKTLPGEEGTASISAKKKGVQFAYLDQEDEKQFTQVSPLREPPACIHYQQCTSCHYQHTSYKEELNFKAQSLNFLIKKLQRQNAELFLSTLSAIHSQALESFPVEVIPCSQRFNYRNRIQLHYQVKQKKLGFYNSFLKDIIPVNSCLLPVPQIRKAVEELYRNDQWLQLIPPSDRQRFPEGHLEIYLLNLGQKEELKYTWNRPYAEGGFTQVNEEMNQKLLSLTEQLYQLVRSSGAGANGAGAKDELTSVVDLFGGSGNLSRRFHHSATLVVDQYINQENLQTHQTALPLDLYHPSALQQIKKRLRHPVQLLLLDPPRSGMKNLNQAVQLLDPQHVIYVSCNPQTLFRDLTSLPKDRGYKIQKIILLDLFPSTYHFETLLWLKKENNS